MFTENDNDNNHIADSNPLLDWFEFGLEFEQFIEVERDFHEIP